MNACVCMCGWMDGSMHGCVKTLSARQDKYLHRVYRVSVNVHVGYLYVFVDKEGR